MRLPFGWQDGSREITGSADAVKTNGKSGRKLGAVNINQ